MTTTILQQIETISRALTGWRSRGCPAAKCQRQVSASPDVSRPLLLSPGRYHLHLPGDGLSGREDTPTGLVTNDWSRSW